MSRIAVVVLLVVAGCSRTPEVIEPEEIDVCPVLTDQLENLLESIVDFVEESDVADLDATGGTASELRSRGVELTDRATALGCDLVEIRDQVSVDGLRSEDPVAQRFIELVLESLAETGS